MKEQDVSWQHEIQERMEEKNAEIRSVCKGSRIIVL